MAAFKDVLHRLRKQYLGKQFTLAATLGCTEAAVSYWEHGRRRPQQELLPRLLECFRASGAQEPEVTELHEAYDGGNRMHAAATPTSQPVAAASTPQGEHQL
jgi:transcriptional regulator with XRE-family HTH domain